MNRPFTIAFIDFDETLFHTQNFKKDMVRVFSAYDVPSEKVWETFRPVEHDGHDDTYYVYTFEKHVTLLNELGYTVPESAVKELKNLLHNSYIMADAEEFLTWMRTVADEVLILSSGDKSFQMMKIESSGLARFVSDVIITHSHKEEVVRTLIKPQKNYVFINDNLTENIHVHKALPEMRIVARINTFMFPEADYRASGISCFFTLEEIKNYITSSPF